MCGGRQIVGKVGCFFCSRAVFQMLISSCECLIIPGDYMVSELTCNWRNRYVTGKASGCVKL